MVTLLLGIELRRSDAVVYQLTVDSIHAKAHKVSPGLDGRQRKSELARCRGGRRRGKLLVP